MQKLNLPELLVITGQSGAGKGTVTKILSRLCLERDIPIVKMGTGDAIRIACEKDTYLFNKMRKLHNTGEKQPGFFALGLWFIAIGNIMREGNLNILEGAPRSERQVEDLVELIECGYFSSLKIVEVIAPNRICKKRLIARTKKDKRSDLSIDEKPGIPDVRKIRRKMAWWNERRARIVRTAKKAGIYLQIDNSGKKQNTERGLIKLFA